MNKHDQYLQNLPSLPVLPQENYMGRNNHGRVLLNTLISTGLFFSTFTAAAMKAEHETNPIHAFGRIADNVEKAITGEYCPPIPSAEAIDRRLDSAETPTVDIDAFKIREEAEAKGIKFLSQDNLNKTYEKIDSADTAEKMTEIASELLEQEYGFKLTLNIQEPAFSTPVAMNYYNQVVSQFLYILSYLPSDLLRATSTKEIIIDPTFLDGQHAIGDFTAKAYRTDGKIRFDINFLSSPFIFFHEALGHGIQNTVCDGVPENDTSYENLNPSGYRYDGTGISSSNERPDVVASVYSEKSPKEDQADLIGIYLTSYDSENPLKYDRSQPIAVKLATLLDRIDTLVPGSVDYLSQMRPIFKRFASMSDGIQKIDFSMFDRVNPKL